MLRSGAEMVGERLIACVMLDRFRARLELARRPELANRSGVIIDRSTHESIVLDYLPAVPETVAGMTLKQARSYAPDAVLIDADESHYRREFERLLDALGEVSDRVEGAELGVAYVGLDSTSAMNDELPRAVPEHFKPRVGLGPNKFTSFVAARVRRSSGVTTVPRNAAAFLEPHSVELLPCSSHLRDDLQRLGLHTLGDLAAQEPHALLDRFGREGRRAWEFAKGIDGRPLQPRVDEEPVTETLSLPTESTSLPLLQAALDTLLQRLYAQPRMQSRYAETALLTCVLEDAPTWEQTFHFKTKVGSWQRAAKILKPRLEAEHPRAPVEAMTLTLTNLSGASGEQGSLFPNLRHDRERRLVETERQLQTRLQGKPSLCRLVEVAPWHPAPESRTVQVSIDPLTDDGMRPLTTPAMIAVREGPNQEPLAVRLGQQWRDVTRIEEQWSFDFWWRPTPMTRSYYRVGQADGRQLVLFHDQREACWYRQSGAA